LVAEFGVRGNVAASQRVPRFQCLGPSS
jgi:hypothetical protein